LAVAALCVLVSVLSGCGQYERFGHDPDIAAPADKSVEPALVAGRYGGAMVTANSGDPKTFNQWTADDNISGNITGMLYDSLITRDSYTLRYESRLAYMPKISKDGLTYTFTLRPNLKWSDGYPLTADDVIFSLDVLFDPKIETLYINSLLIPVTQPNGSVKQVPFKYEKIDDRTVRFTLPCVFAPAMDAFGFNIIPKHALEAAYRSGQFNSAWGIDTPPSEIVGCGPFDMEQYLPGQRVVYRRNPYYWRWNGKDHLPYLDSWVYNIAPDDNAMALNFRAGGSDDITVPTHLYPTFARYARRDNYTMLDDGPAWDTGFLVFNENPTSTMSKTPTLLKLFQNEQFRQACSYAVDRDTVINEVQIGLARPLFGPVSPANTVFFDPNIKTYPFDLAKARRMLLQLGMTPGADGKLQYESRPVKFTILTSTEGSSKDIATIMVDDFQKIGLDAEQSNITFENLDTKISSPPYDWQAVIMGFGGGPEPNAVADLWRTSSFSHIWWPKQPHPETEWEARIESDFSKAVQTLDLNERRKYYDDWQEVVSEEQPMIYIDNPEIYEALRNHFGNVKPCSTGGATWNPEELFDTKAKGFMPAQ
jgi:peptide/nickel transport system substrate-binding protein